MSEKYTPDQIKALREKANHTQQSMADALGLSLRTYQRYEGGEVPVSKVVWLASNHIVNCTKGKKK